MDITDLAMLGMLDQSKTKINKNTNEDTKQINRKTMINNTNYDTCDFDFEKIKVYCDGLPSKKEQLQYLDYVLKIHRQQTIDEGSTQVWGLLGHKLSNEISYRDNRRSGLQTKSQQYEFFLDDFNKTMEACSQIKSLGEQIDYLSYVYKECRNVQAEKEKFDHTNFMKKVIIEKQSVERNLELEHSDGKTQAKASSDKLVKPIQWKGSNADLVQLFELLKDHYLVSQDSYENRYALIVSHFIDKEGNPFKQASLKQTRHQITKHNDKGESKNAKKLEEIVKKTKSKT